MEYADRFHRQQFRREGRQSTRLRRRNSHEGGVRAARISVTHFIEGHETLETLVDDLDDPVATLLQVTTLALRAL